MAKDSGFRLYSVFAGLFVASLLISNATSAKIFALGPLFLPGGLILFPISYIFGDILTEVYGFERSRKIIWTGFLCLGFSSIAYIIVGALPPAPFWTDQAAYDKILGVAPRIAMGGVIAYLFGEYSNSFVLSKMKYWAEGRKGVSQAWRFVASTIVGEAVDSIIFMSIAFSGILTFGNLVRTGISIYLFKVVYEVLATPITVRFSNWVKQIELTDHIDRPAETSYKLFQLREEHPTDK